MHDPLRLSALLPAMMNSRNNFLPGELRKLPRVPDLIYASILTCKRGIFYCLCSPSSKWGNQRLRKVTAFLLNQTAHKQKGRTEWRLMPAPCTNALCFALWRSETNVPGRIERWDGSFLIPWLVVYCMAILGGVIRLLLVTNEMGMATSCATSGLWVLPQLLKSMNSLKTPCKCIYPFYCWAPGLLQVGICYGLNCIPPEFICSISSSQGLRW